MTKSLSTEIAQKCLKDYQAAFRAHDLSNARVARTCAALAYMTHEKEVPTDFDSLAISVTMNIQRGCPYLPHRDPRYISYTKTIARMLSYSENLAHPLYSVLFFHSVDDQPSLRKTLERSLDLVELYPQPVYARLNLEHVVNLLSGRHVNEPNRSAQQPSVCDDLFELAISLFRHDF